MKLIGHSLSRESPESTWKDEEGEDMTFKKVTLDEDDG
jgi:hypothetical protein